MEKEKQTLLNYMNFNGRYITNVYQLFRILVALKRYLMIIGNNNKEIYSKLANCKYSLLIELMKMNLNQEIVIEEYKYNGEILKDVFENIKSVYSF